MSCETDRTNSASRHRDRECVLIQSGSISFRGRGLRLMDFNCNGCSNGAILAKNGVPFNHVSLGMVLIGMSLSYHHSKE